MILDACLFLALSMAANPITLSLSSLRSRHSCSVRFLAYCAMSNCKITAFAMWNCSLAPPKSDLLQIFRSAATL